MSDVSPAGAVAEGSTLHIAHFADSQSISPKHVFAFSDIDGRRLIPDIHSRTGRPIYYLKRH